jgi:UDP-N-acetylglucosamine transferase subunit ALG13
VSTIPAPKVVVSLGTDYHKFNRLVSWIDGWLARQLNPPRCVVQHGSSYAPLLAEGVTMVSHQEILDLYAGADIVVCQGGPGSIFDSLSTGHVPVVVPRLAKLHEAVDDHQVEFTRQMARHGEAIMADSAEALWAELDRDLREPQCLRCAPRPSGSALAADALGQAIEELQRGGKVSIRRLRQLIH